MAGSSQRSAAHEEAMVWDPAALVRASANDGTRFAAIILNQPVSTVHRSLVERVWQSATLRLCADGGANRLYDCFGDQTALPHEIRGDLDSLRQNVREVYGDKHGVPIVKAASQYATDLQKCVLRVEEEERTDTEKREMAIVILGGLSGRLDQTAHTMHVLCQLARKEADDHGARHKDLDRNNETDEESFATLEKRAKTIVLSENSIAWLLGKGKHVIHIDHDIFGPTCGLLPFAAQLDADTPSFAPTITTSGLEWNFNGEQSAIGGFLSTSNHLKADRIIIEVDAPILWTMEIKEDK